jgi:hypothetical protein
VCIATGPSLTAEQIDYVHQARIADRCRVIAINEAGLGIYHPLSAPWADVLYAADSSWWRHYQPEFYGYRISGEPVEERTVSLNGKTVTQVGVHSGFQALQLAITCGATKTILIGFDCSKDGGRNCHHNRPDHFKRDPNMNAWAEVYRRISKEWPDDEVLNATIRSKIDAFPRVRLEDVL